MIFINLPFAKLERMALKARLDEIGEGPVGALARSGRAERCGSASTAWAASAGSRCGRRSARCDRPDDDPRADNRLDIVHVNEIKGGAAVTAHLLEFDSLHGRWRQKFAADDDRAIVIGNRRIGFSAASLPGEVPWGDLGCDIVLECTGKFLKPDQLAGLFRPRRAARHRRRRRSRTRRR